MSDKEIIDKIRKIQKENISQEQKSDFINNLLQSQEERYLIRFLLAVTSTEKSSISTLSSRVLGTSNPSVFLFSE